MTHLQLRSVAAVSLLSIGLLLRPSSSALAEDPERRDSQSQAALATEARVLRREVEALRHRVEQLERAKAGGAWERGGGDPEARARLLAETEKILGQFHAGKAGVWKEAHGRIRELRLEVGAALKELQDGYTRRARLEEAVAIRDAIDFLREAGRRVHPDPGTLYSMVETCRVLFFRVTGASSGSLYGTDVYTSDSTLAVAAVHAGVVKPGQTGIVKVTTIPSHPAYVGSARNGITSSSWGCYPGYRVEAPGDEDMDLDDPAACGVASTAVGPHAPGLAPPASANEAPRCPAPDQPPSANAQLPRNLPADAREHVEHFNTAAAEIRKGARDQVCRLAREAIDRLAPIQDAHTRAARLDEAIATREVIRKLTDYAERR